MTPRIHEDVTLPTPWGGVDWKRLSVGDIVAFRVSQAPSTKGTYWFDPNMNHPEALYWYKLLDVTPDEERAKGTSYISRWEAIPRPTG